MSVVVVTDSSACIPPEFVDDLGITVVPLHVLVDDKDLLDGVDDIDLDGGPVTTSGASPQALREAYREALKRSGGDGVLAVHISRDLSGTWDAGRAAAGDVGDKVRVVDSRSAAMGLGFPVLAAARAATAGADLDTTYDIAVESSASTRSYIVVDRLDQLRKGGRIGAAAALLGSALSMKPVLHIRDGKLLLKEKTRTFTKARTRLADLVVAGATDDTVSVAVHHLRARERAQGLADLLTERIPNLGAVLVSEFSAVLGAHVGPGALGVVLSPRAEPKPGSSTGEYSSTE